MEEEVKVLTDGQRSAILTAVDSLRTARAGLHATRIQARQAEAALESLVGHCEDEVAAAMTAAGLRSVEIDGECGFEVTTGHSCVTNAPIPQLHQVELRPRRAIIARPAVEVIAREQGEK